MRRRATKDSRIGALIPSVLSAVQRRHGELAFIQQRWTRLVGKQLAAHTTPVSLRKGRLVVRVDRPGDGFALNYERPEVLRRVNAIKAGAVDELIIRPG